MLGPRAHRTQRGLPKGKSRTTTNSSSPESKQASSGCGACRTYSANHDLTRRGASPRHPSPGGFSLVVVSDVLTGVGRPGDRSGGSDGCNSWLYCSSHCEGLLLLLRNACGGARRGVRVVRALRMRYGGGSSTHAHTHDGVRAGVKYFVRVLN